MTIKHININNARNIVSISESPHPKFNIIYGENGSGKTSFLESVYFMSTGRSFRSTNFKSFINNSSDMLNLFIKCFRDEELISIGLEKTTEGRRSLKIDNQFIHSIAVLSKLLPVQLITTTSYRFFHDGPKLRRQFIDWGLFHVKPEYIDLWKKFQKTLKQRNAAIKAHRYPQEITSWDSYLVDYGNAINSLRQAYVKDLEPVVKAMMKKLLHKHDNITLDYSKGWENNKNLDEALQNSLTKDLKYGYTQIGPQRADLSINYNGTPIQEHFSQGQQKLMIYSLKLAQGQHLQEINQRNTILLIDDLPSELDSQKQACICDILSSLNTQIFITAINTDSIVPCIAKGEREMFHMEQGKMTRTTDQQEC